jgi:DivIVA domain-containing protein
VDTAGYAHEWQEAAVNGNEVRRLIFPQGSGGYDTAAVGELLDRVAAELDAGRPAGPVIEGVIFPAATGDGHGALLGKSGGYDFVAVDGVVAQLRRQDDPAVRADPWRDLPAWHYGMAIPEAGAADPVRAWRQAAPPRAARRRAAKDYEQACADAWRDFSLAPGTQLSLERTGMFRSELRGDGYTLVSVQFKLRLAMENQTSTYCRDGRTYTPSPVKKAQWPAVAAQIAAREPISAVHLPPTAPAPRTGAKAARSQAPAAREGGRMYSLSDWTGLPVLYTGGSHLDGRAHGYVEFPGQRSFRFPVRGTARSNAIMTAVDQAGRPVARYRVAAESLSSGWRVIEITVHPDHGLTDELSLMLAVTAPWVWDYFAVPH